jgi:isocitrate dehydrogenase
MLVHIGQGEVATRVHNAWLATLEDGVHTYDIFNDAVSKEKVGTREFATAVIERLGKQPKVLKAVRYPSHGRPITVTVKPRARPHKELVGTDVFVEWLGTPNDLGQKLERLAGPDLRLVMITNRGTKVYPEGVPETVCVDHWRCRFQSAQREGPVTPEQMVALLSRLVGGGVPPIKTEGLFTFDGKPGFSLGQGQ